MNTYNVVVTVSTTVCIDAENPDDAIEKVSQALNNGDVKRISSQRLLRLCKFAVATRTGCVRLKLEKQLPEMAAVFCCRKLQNYDICDN